MLPRRIPKAPKRASRWRSQAHRDWVRGFTCCICGSSTNIEVAHVRMGSGAGVGQKPDDWRTVPLCAGPFSSKDGQLGCHDRQHVIGEPTFWANAEKAGVVLDKLLAELEHASPRAAQIRQAQREREHA